MAKYFLVRKVIWRIIRGPWPAMDGHGRPGPDQPAICQLGQASLAQNCQLFGQVFLVKGHLFGQDLGQPFGQDFGQTKQQKQQHSLQQRRGAREARAPLCRFRPRCCSCCSVLAWAGLGQKIDLGWPGASPRGPGQALGWPRVKPWVGPWSSHGKIDNFLDSCLQFSDHFLPIFWPFSSHGTDANRH